MALKRELAIWLDAKLTEIERRHNLDAKNAALLRSMAIKRLTKFKKSKNVIIFEKLIILSIVIFYFMITGN